MPALLPGCATLYEGWCLRERWRCHSETIGWLPRWIHQNRSQSYFEKLLLTWHIEHTWWEHCFKTEKSLSPTRKNSCTLLCAQMVCPSNTNPYVLSLIVNTPGMDAVVQRVLSADNQRISPQRWKQSSTTQAIWCSRWLQCNGSIMSLHK